MKDELFTHRDDPDEYIDDFEDEEPNEQDLAGLEMPDLLSEDIVADDDDYEDFEQNDCADFDDNEEYYDNEENYFDDEGLESEDY